MNDNGHAQIISLLGGGKKLTARLKSLTEENVNEKTVYSWVQQGIPDRWKVAVARCLLEDNIEINDCEDWDTEDIDGFIYIGYIGANDPGIYSMDSSSKIYIIGAGEELGEAIGGGLAILGSWGVLCCGGFFLLLGGIFALTLKKAEPQVVVVNQAAPAFAAPAATHMAAPQYEQPQQYQQVQQPQQYQQPPQGGI